MSQSILSAVRKLGGRLSYGSRRRMERVLMVWTGARDEGDNNNKLASFNAASTFLFHVLFCTTG